MKKVFAIGFFLALFMQMMSPQGYVATAGPGDTVVVRTFNFDTNMRAGVFQFPDDTTKTWEKITMLYSMRCKNGLVSTGSNTNLGCGEWDYNCYTYLVDSTQTDSLKLTHPNYLVSNFSGNTFYFTSNPVYNYTQTQQQVVNYLSVITEDTTVLGNGTMALNHPLNPSSLVSRTQYLWTATELLAGGLTAGDITGLRLDLSGIAGYTLSNFSIRIKAIASDSLQAGAPDLDGFSSVYFSNTFFPSTGIQAFPFLSAFNWDGIANLIVEFSFTNATSLSLAATVQGDMATAGKSLQSNTDDSFLWLNHNGQFIDVPDTAFSSINNEITLAFWVYGNPASLPANTTIIEGVDQNNQRQLNLHLPWSDSNIYFDCGNVGGVYDRINLAANNADIEGKWNFWTFTKNAVTGIMRIYLNGALWHTGTGKTKPITMTDLKIGTSSNGGLGYYGGLNELSLWNKELSLSSIRLLMHQSIQPSHPDYAFLTAYYPLNEGSGSSITDNSPILANTQVINPSWRSIRGADLYMNFSDLGQRPNLLLIQGSYTDTVITTTVLDSVLSSGVSVSSYQVISNNLVAIDTVYGWQAGNNFVYNTAGAVVDTLFTNPTDTFNISQMNYYRKRPMRVELINFITPYGINLNMNGLIGKTWEFDVTDYAPILKGKRFMAMEDGAYQEDNDIKFVFTEGTPPRDVMSLQQIWPSGSWVFPSYNDIVNNVHFEPRTLPLSANAAQFKIRSAISGHGQEGEFIPRNHTIRVNNSVDLTRQVWKFCGDNPIYPQGGTWVYDRAGWCPGAAVDVAEYELDGIATPGQALPIDYTLPPVGNPGSSNYRVNNQLVAYGPANFTSDAAIDFITKPSRRTEFGRLNPLCDKPLITIKNTGSTTLTSLTIVYGRVGGTMSTYTWNGNLEFMKTTQVELPTPNWQSSNQPQFIAYVKNPNGAADQYAYNDTLRSDFEGTPYYPSKLIFELKTNNYGYETEFTLKDSVGLPILQRTGLQANTTYRDTLTLGTGCYTVYLTDQGNDGLSFWANSAQGSGFFRIRDASTNQLIKTFNGDFGHNIYQQFTVNYILPVEEIQGNAAQGLTLYPNPASDEFIAEISLPYLSQAEITLVNLLGETVKQESLRVTNDTEKININTSDLPAGVYLFSVRSNDQLMVKRIQITR